MTYRHTTIKLIAASLAGFAFCGSALSQEAPYLAGKYSETVDRVWSLPMSPADTTASIGTTVEQDGTATFAYDNEVLRFPRPRIVDEESVFGNYSANIRAHDLR